MDEGGVLGQETVPRMDRIAFEVLRRLHDSLDVEVAVEGVGSDDFMRHVCKSNGQRQAVFAAVDDGRFNAEVA